MSGPLSGRVGLVAGATRGAAVRRPRRGRPGRRPDVARWNGASVSSGDLAQAYGFTDADGTRPDCRRYLVEVQERGRPADDTGCRRAGTTPACSSRGRPTG